MRENESNKNKKKPIEDHWNKIELKFVLVLCVFISALITHCRNSIL